MPVQNIKIKAINKITQKITTTVSWPGADAVVISEYMTRRMNKSCAQTNWSVGGSVGAKACTSLDYDIKTASINTASESLKLNPQ